ncbi:hypothetical protein EJ110_NYTH55860 [Nymphaea thermarum]|nr:hypothetical protein EJ110_NYTH55860 [Nymphaea thermarum]
MLSVTGHRKKHIIEEDEPINKTGKYITWEEDDSMVMSWMMNSVQPQIASTITYYTTAKEMYQDPPLVYTRRQDLSHGRPSDSSRDVSSTEGPTQGWVLGRAGQVFPGPGRPVGPEAWARARPIILSGRSTQNEAQPGPFGVLTSTHVRRPGSPSPLPPGAATDGPRAAAGSAGATSHAGTVPRRPSAGSARRERGSGRERGGERGRGGAVGKGGIERRRKRERGSGEGLAERGKGRRVSGEGDEGKGRRGRGGGRAERETGEKEGGGEEEGEGDGGQEEGERDCGRGSPGVGLAGPDYLARARPVLGPLPGPSRPGTAAGPGRIGPTPSPRSTELDPLCPTNALALISSVNIIYGWSLHNMNNQNSLQPIPRDVNLEGVGVTLGSSMQRRNRRSRVIAAARASGGRAAAVLLWAEKRPIEGLCRSTLPVNTLLRYTGHVPSTLSDQIQSSRHFKEFCGCARALGYRLPNLGVLGKAKYLCLEFTHSWMSALPLHRVNGSILFWATTGVVSLL